MTDTPWEPPLAGSDLEHLVGALDRLRTTFRWKTAVFVTLLWHRSCANVRPTPAKDVLPQSLSGVYTYVRSTAPVSSQCTLAEFDDLSTERRRTVQIVSGVPTFEYQ